MEPAQDLARLLGDAYAKTVDTEGFGIFAERQRRKTKVYGVIRRRRYRRGRCSVEGVAGRAVRARARHPLAIESFREQKPPSPLQPRPGCLSRCPIKTRGGAAIRGRR